MISNLLKALNYDQPRRPAQHRAVHETVEVRMIPGKARSSVTQNTTHKQTELEPCDHPGCSAPAHQKSPVGWSAGMSSSYANDAPGATSVTAKSCPGAGDTNIPWKCRFVP